MITLTRNRLSVCVPPHNNNNSALTPEPLSSSSSSSTCRQKRIYVPSPHSLCALSDTVTYTSPDTAILGFPTKVAAAAAPEEPASLMAAGHTHKPVSTALKVLYCVLNIFSACAIVFANKAVGASVTAGLGLFNCNLVPVYKQTATPPVATCQAKPWPAPLTAPAGVLRVWIQIRHNPDAHTHAVHMAGHERPREGRILHVQTLQPGVSGTPGVWLRGIHHPQQPQPEPQHRWVLPDTQGARTALAVGCLAVGRSKTSMQQQHQQMAHACVLLGAAAMMPCSSFSVAATGTAA